MTRVPLKDDTFRINSNDVACIWVPRYSGDLSPSMSGIALSWIVEDARTAAYQLRSLDFPDSQGMTSISKCDVMSIGTKSHTGWRIHYCAFRWLLVDVCDHLPCFRRLIRVQRADSAVIESY